MLQNEELRSFCPCRNEEPAIRLEEFRDGSSGESHLAAHYIIFVLKGSAGYTVSGYDKEGLVTRAGEFIFLPVGTNLSYRARKGTTGLAKDVIGSNSPMSIIEPQTERSVCWVA